MGANQSKAASSGKRSPVQEKHTSADSTAPLAIEAARLDTERSTIASKHASCSEKSMGRSRANTMSFNGSLTTMNGPEASPATIHELHGHSNVSRPPPPPRLRHLSELIDPAEISIDSHVRSPSGHLLAPEQYLVHPNRPLSIRERQMAIQERVRAASRLGVEADGADDAPVAQPPKASPTNVSYTPPDVRDAAC
ncbi:hypothetical protein LTR53_002818 [Teratosphaeriaceae sp. CCFEE 6253]|nr:hypothetical protein LTR53_002818 [Teratosphaeriaceae sp. CCFEE 6253]